MHWRSVLAWQIEPTTAAAPVKKLSVEYRFNRKAKVPRTWSILLDPLQLDDFRQALRELQDSGRCSAPLLELKEPTIPKPEKQLPAAAMWCFAVGYGLFIQGLPLFVVGILGPSSDGEASRVASETFKAFITSHFHHAGELRGFCIFAGALLCLAGAWSYINAVKRMKTVSH